MHPCFETIQIKDNVPLHVRFHNERFWLTCKDYFGINTTIDLTTLIKPPLANCRCKIIYDGINFTLEYAPLVQNRKFIQFRLVETSKEYRYKTINRAWLDDLRKGLDEAVLVRDGLLLDTTIANIALKIEGKWLTPQVPLLKGTTRQRLLEEGWINEAPLHVKDLKNAQNFAIMNALLGFLELDLCKLCWEGI